MAEAQRDEETDAVFQKLKNDFTHYAPRCLLIRTKDAGLQPFALNDAQAILHQVAEEQLAAEGMVRIVVLKGRQQGCSTYIEGRFYWKVTHRFGQRAYILTHESDATANLFAMVARYHENAPDEVRPETDRDSGKELNFNRLDSGYKVGTAGTKGTGRSSTIQFFHGSEVAFWPHAETHATGVMQAVPDTPGSETEVWLESTSDGMGNYFHQTWVRAVAGLNGFRAVFIAWFLQSEYTRPVPEGGVTFDDDELLLMEEFGISEGHMLWRRHKVAELKNGEDDFKREYPNTPEEAFESAGYRQLIKASDVRRAVDNGRQLLEDGRPAIEARGPLVLGVDPARFGDDRLAMCLRQGRVAFDIVAYTQKLDQMEIVGLVRQILDAFPIDACFIDVGMGVGVIDRLRELGYENVREVNFGGSAFNKNNYTNRRNEMWQEMADWFDDEHVALFQGDAVDDYQAKVEAATMDLCAVEYKFNSRNQKVLEEKDQTKARIGVSPDMGDALALTFAEPVAEFWNEQPDGQRHQGRNTKTGY
ncbi:MAG: hypothetical protein ACR2PR_03465 [Pseudohongiellaceae bacterium]